jgi:hypothetical protein
LCGGRGEGRRGRGREGEGREWEREAEGERERGREEREERGREGEIYQYFFLTWEIENSRIKVWYTCFEVLYKLKPHKLLKHTDERSKMREAR